ncbi:MAG: hypothetical protein Kow0098_18620 [Ignavibacteriaceae bacterium]
MSLILVPLFILTCSGGNLHYNHPVPDSVNTLKDSLFISKYIVDFEIIKDADSVQTFITISDDKYFLSGENGVIRCFELNGKEKWTTEISGTIYCKPVRDGDLLAAVTVEGDLYSLNANNGNILQVIGVGENLTSALITIQTNFRNEPGTAVVFGSESGQIYCFDLYTFEMHWVCTEVKSIAHSEIYYASDRIILLTDEGLLYCIDARTGLLTWKWDQIKPISGFFPVIKSSVICFVAGSQFFAVDLLSGVTNWKFSKDKYSEILWTDPESHYVYALTKESVIHKVDIFKRKIISKLKTGIEDDLIIRPSFLSDNFLLATVKNSLYLIRTEAGSSEEIFYDSDEIKDCVNTNVMKFLLVNSKGLVYHFSIALQVK